MVTTLRKTPTLKEMLRVSMGTHSPCRNSTLCHRHARSPASAAGAIQPGLVLGLQHPAGAIAGLGDGCRQGQCFGRAMARINICCTSAEVLA